MRTFFIGVACLFLFSSVRAAAPVVLFTDILSGPTAGGENNKGIYLSIFGRNFGTTGPGSTVKVYIGAAEVDNYRSIGVSRGAGTIQQITVQVGALGNSAAGTALPVKVVAGGLESNTDKTFMPNPGRILFVDNVAGNDTTAVIGDITHPFRHVQTPTLSQAAWGQVRPGDFIVMRGKGAEWTDIGFENYFMRYRDKSGSAPTGASGTGPIVIMGYPGEDVYIHGTLAAGMTGGCISAINGQSYPTAGKWAVVTNLRIDCEGYDGPISQEIYGDNWRVINNELSASTAPTTGSSVPRMAGITGNGQNSVWLGNHIHDIQGSPQECHGIYIDGDGSYEIAYNNIHDIRSGNGFQVYVNGGNGSDVAGNVSFHHNQINTVSKHGINIADGASDNFTLYDNVVLKAADAGIRFNTTTLHGCRIYNNTFYNCNTAANSSYGMIMNDWNPAADAVDMQNNIFCPHAGTPYTGGSNGGEVAVMGTYSHNVWFGGTGSISFDAGAISGDPGFVVPGTDFHLQTGSPAIDAGVNTISAVVNVDFDGIARPQGAGYDAGAYEYVPGVEAVGANARKTAVLRFSVASTGSSRRVTFAVPTAAIVHLSLCTCRGVKIADILNSKRDPGLYSATIEAQTISTGLYLCTLKEGPFGCAKLISIVK